MMELMILGGLGLLLGLTLQKCGLTSREGVRRTVMLTAWEQARTWLYTLGLGMLGTALLGWLAVIDVDQVQVLPLHSGVLIGSALAGVGIGLGGAAPCRLLGGIGGGRLLESLCGVAGCAAGLFAARLLPMEALRGLITPIQGTLFRFTLTDGWLLDGRFVGLASLGALICVSALLFRPREEVVPEESDDELRQLDALEDPVEETDAESDAELEAAKAQCIVSDAEPVNVDDGLPEIEPEEAGGTDEDWQEQQAERPSPMEDEALDEVEAALEPDVASMKDDGSAQPKPESEGRT